VGIQRKVRAKLAQRVVLQLKLVFPQHGDSRLPQKTWRIKQHQAVHQVLLERMGEELTAAFEQVRAWRRRDLGTLAQAWPDDSKTAQAFRTWRDANRGPLARRILRGPA